MQSGSIKKTLHKISLGVLITAINENTFYILVGLLVGVFLGSMITGYLYFPDCWKTSSCVDRWWEEPDFSQIGSVDGGDKACQNTK